MALKKPWANVEQSLMRCEPKDIEKGIDTGRKSLGIKVTGIYVLGFSLVLKFYFRLDV